MVLRISSFTIPLLRGFLIAVSMIILVSPKKRGRLVPAPFELLSRRFGQVVPTLHLLCIAAHVQLAGIAVVVLVDQRHHLRAEFAACHLSARQFLAGLRADDMALGAEKDE